MKTKTIISLSVFVLTILIIQETRVRRALAVATSATATAEKFQKTAKDWQEVGEKALDQHDKVLQQNFQLCEAMPMLRQRSWRCGWYDGATDMSMILRAAAHRPETFTTLLMLRCDEVDAATNPLPLFEAVLREQPASPNGQRMER